ncbi:uncharacterized protein LOC113212389 [Frankliniella occidentalis]|uniref:Uncharacterized protein LOC113212389 n=1 Tax=Frankliniella occidentalis TaxID=133901 RepID=A0A6J1T0V9_FRAOC|nr:uncharacterized protein LOC113212389 [Frankliniella occidentalis]
MDTWQSDEDFLRDMNELNEIGEEVNEQFWMIDSSSNEEPPEAKPTSVIPIETPTISSAATQRKITYDIISDMSKANISFEPDYKELMVKQKLLASSKDSSKEPQGFKKPQKWKPMPESQGPTVSNQFNWQPVDPTPFSVKPDEFPTLGKK